MTLVEARLVARVIWEQEDGYGTWGSCQRLLVSFPEFAWHELVAQAGRDSYAERLLEDEHASASGADNINIGTCPIAGCYGITGRVCFTHDAEYL